MSYTIAQVVLFQSKMLDGSTILRIANAEWDEMNNTIGEI